MAVALATITSNVATDGSTSVTAPALTPSGTNRFLLGVAASDQGPVSGSLPITYNSGTAMTNAWNVTYETYFRNTGYYVIAPATSSFTLTATPDAAQYGIWVAAMAFTGVDQTTPLGTAVSGSTTLGLSVSVSPSSAVNDLVVDNVFGNAATITVQAGQTSNAESDAFVVYDSAGTSSKAGAAGTTTMGWDRTDTAYGIGTVAVAVKAVSASVTVVKALAALGVG